MRPVDSRWQAAECSLRRAFGGLPMFFGSLLADTAFLEGKSRLVQRLDALHRRGEPFPAADERLASGVMQGARYRVTARGADVPASGALTDQLVTVTSSCEAPDATRVNVV